MAEKKKYDSDIVGWYTKSGKRIPVRKGDKKAQKERDDKLKKIYWYAEGETGEERKANALKKEKEDFKEYQKKALNERSEIKKPNDEARKRRAKRKGSQEYSNKEWDALTNRQRRSIIEAESKRNKKKGIRALERKEPE